MKDDTVVVAARGELLEVLACLSTTLAARWTIDLITHFRCVFPVELQFDLTKTGLEDHVATHCLVVTNVTEWYSFVKFLCELFYNESLQHLSQVRKPPLL